MLPKEHVAAFKALKMPPFSAIPLRELTSAIELFIANLEKGTSSDTHRLIRVFNVIRSKMPAQLVTPLFEFVADKPFGLDFESIVEEFIALPDVQYEIIRMKQVLAKRKVERYTATTRHPPVDRSYFTTKQPPRSVFVRDEDDRSTTQPVRTYFESDILPQCQSVYKRAPWMKQFVDVPIQGMAIKKTGAAIDQYATDEPVGIFEEPGWFRVKSSWYEMACEEAGRKFVPDIVAYVLNDATGPSATTIIETKEMFDAAKAGIGATVGGDGGVVGAKQTSAWLWQQPPDLISFQAVVALLSENSVLKELKATNPSTVVFDEIAHSLPKSSNKAIARALSKVLVFLSPLIVERQIHIVRVKNMQYKLKDLVKLSAKECLPEAFYNPTKNTSEITEIIAKRRKLIENDFYETIESFRRRAVKGEHIRRRMAPTKSSSIIKRPSIPVPPICPANTEDIVYYSEDGQMFCFARSAVAGISTNPLTGKSFSDDFMKEVKRLRAPRNESGGSRETKSVGMREVGETTTALKDIELAPGLFQKLNEEINALMPIYCAKCNKEVPYWKYKSFDQDRLVLFCDKHCFDTYKFGAKRQPMAVLEEEDEDEEEEGEEEDAEEEDLSSPDKSKIIVIPKSVVKPKRTSGFLQPLKKFED
jgi:hypothetical protein